MGKIAVIGEAGGMRNAIVAGFVIGSGLHPEFVDAYYGASSAIGNGLYFATGQFDDAVNVWADNMTTPEVLRWRKIFRKQPPADLELMAQHACARLDVAKLQSSQIDLVASVVRMDDGILEYKHVNSENYREIFQATCSIPFVAPPIDIDGVRYVDGGVSDPLPVLKAYEDGYTNLIVLCNKPEESVRQARMVKRMLQWAKYEGLRLGVEKGIDRYQHTWAFLNKPPSGARVYLFVPPKNLVPRRFERDPERIHGAFEDGLELGAKERANLEAFIRSA